MHKVKDWRSPKTADDFASLDYADFAQEFLRRNPAYCREYHTLMRRIAAKRLDGTAELEKLARRWGLSFPVRPRSPGRRSAGVVDAGTVGKRRHPRRRTPGV